MHKWKRQSLKGVWRKIGSNGYEEEKSITLWLSNKRISRDTQLTLNLNPKIERRKVK